MLKTYCRCGTGSSTFSWKCGGKLNLLLRVERGTEITAMTTEGQKIFIVTIGTADSRESLVEITTFQKLPDYKRDYRPIKTVFFGKEVVISLLELVEMFIEKLPQ